MIKRLGILAGICMLLGAAAFAANVRTVEINGQSMISLRDFGDQFDATITSNYDRDGFTIILDHRYVDMIPYSNWAWIDDHEVRLKAPVVIIDDVTYLPLDFLLDAFDLGCERVNYNTQVVFIRHRPSFRVILVLDNDWGRQRHVLRHRYDCHDYFNFRITINLGDRPHNNYDGYRYDRYNGRQQDNRPPVIKRDHHKDRTGIGGWLLQRNNRTNQYDYHNNSDRKSNKPTVKNGSHDTDKYDGKGNHESGNSKGNRGQNTGKSNGNNGNHEPGKSNSNSGQNKDSNNQGKGNSKSTSQHRK